MLYDLFKLNQSNFLSDRLKVANPSKVSSFPVHNCLVVLTDLSWVL